MTNKTHNSIPVFLSADNYYAPFVGPCVCSICENTSENIIFYILERNISNHNKRKIRRLCKKYKNCEVKFNSITDADMKNPATKSGLSTSAFARLLIPNIFPNIDRVIYLDVDIIAMGDIKTLWDQDLGDYIIGAASGHHGIDFAHVKSFEGISPSHEYFNSGVMIIDCDKWREQNLTEKLFDLEYKTRGKREHNDQSVLNIYFDNNYKKLPDEFNVTSHSLRYFRNNDKPGYDAIMNACVLRHFTDSRPWYENKIEHYDEFWHLARISGFYPVLAWRSFVYRHQDFFSRFILDKKKRKELRKKSRIQNTDHKK